MTPEPNIRTPEEVQENIMICETTGSVKPKKYPFVEDEIELLGKGPAKLAENAGLTEDLVVFNGGAPSPHMSGPLSWMMFEVLGATVLNDHRMEYEDVFEEVDPSEIDVFTTVPMGAYSFAEDLREENEEWFEEFNPDWVLAGGDYVLDWMREDFDRMFGAEVLEMYALTEGGIVGIEEEPGEGIALNTEDYDFGLYDLEAETLTDIQNLEGPETGSMVISCDQISWLSNVKPGDMVEIDPEDNSMQYLGREDEMISMGGAPLYPAQIENILRDLYGEELGDWKAVVDMDREDKTVKLDLYLQGVEGNVHEFTDKLPDYAPAVDEAVRDFNVADVGMTGMEGSDVGFEPGPKRKRVEKTEAYKPAF